MKSFIIAVVILCLMLFMMVGHTFLLGYAGQRLDTITQNIMENVEIKNWEEVDSQVRMQDKEWDRISKWISCLIEHDETDQIMVSIASVSEYAKHRETPELMSETAVLRRLIDHIPQKELPIPQNIF